MNPDLLEVPLFARLSDYAGLWAMEPDCFRILWQMGKAMDLAAHMRQHNAKPVPFDGSGHTVKPEAAAPEKLSIGGDKSISVIRLSGLLMKSASSMGGTSTVQARRDIRQAAADPNVAGILLLMETPGGTVAGTDDLAKDVKAARRSKPVYAHADDLLASAGYWVASQAEKIYANSPTALVGSLGTIQVIRDYSAAAEQAGIKTHVFATGPLKGLGAEGSKVTDEQASHVQALVDKVQMSFDAAVKKGRGFTDKQLADVRHGGVLTAGYEGGALEKGLIDGIQPLAKTISEFTRTVSGPRANLDHGMAAVVGSLPMRLRGLPTLNKGN